MIIPPGFSGWWKGGPVLNYLVPGRWRLRFRLRVMDGPRFRPLLDACYIRHDGTQRGIYWTR